MNYRSLEAGVGCFIVALTMVIFCPPTRMLEGASVGTLSKDDVDDDVSEESGNLSEYTDVILEYRLRLRVDL